MQLDPSAFLAAPELLHALEKRAIPVRCDEERVLFHQGDLPTGLFIVKKGLVNLSMDPGANQNLFACQTGTGSVLGVPALIGNLPYSLTAVALPGAELGFLSRENFDILMQTEQTLMLMILQILAAEVRSARLALAQL